MKIFFIRHGETVANVAGLLAGSLDSPLTNHGVLQTKRLGKYLFDRGQHFTHIYASDKQRALMTAGAVADAQRENGLETVPQVIQLVQLREQDFGSLEGIPWMSKEAQAAPVSGAPHSIDPVFVPKESEAVMVERAKDFVDNFLIPLLATDEEEEKTIAVASHGIFLTTLWRQFLCRFTPHSVLLNSDVLDTIGTLNLETVRGWANTGYLEARVRLKSNETDSNPRESASSPIGGSNLQILTGHQMLVKAINSTEHLHNLRRTGGGVGSARHDPHQKSIECFFKKT